MEKNNIEPQIQNSSVTAESNQTHSAIQKIEILQQLIKFFYDAPDDALFDQKTVAGVRGCSEATMERDRWSGGGIPFKKIGRKVLYKKIDVIEWLNSFETRVNTSIIQ